MCENNCVHYKQALMICENHDQHADQIIKFGTYDPRQAFYIECNKGKVETVTISTVPFTPNECEHKGCCTLTLIKMYKFSNSTPMIGAKDNRGNVYAFNSTCVIAFS